MENILKLLIIGGDKRQIYMSEYLKEKGFEVSLYGFDGINKKLNHKGGLKNAINLADIIILPLPGSHDSVNINAPFAKSNIAFEDIIDSISEKKSIFGGMLPSEWVTRIKEKGIKYYDYFAREELALLNAVPTAEGVVGTIITKLPITVKDANIAITGFGRCGAATAKALNALGAKITIVVRNTVSMAKASIEGYDACLLKDFTALAHAHDVIVNTVPSLIIDKDILRQMKSDAVIIEIASAPFGIDFEAAQDLKINVIKEGSIPGRTAPKTAGKIISDTIFQMIEEGENG